MDSLVTFRVLISKLIAIITSLEVLFHFGQLRPLYSVAFYDADGETVLAVENVTEDKCVPLPSAPIKSGLSFLGWSGTYVDVSKNENVRAVYNDEQNVFVISSAKGSPGDIIKTLIRIDGIVTTCGFDFTIHYDEALELISFDDNLDLDIIANLDSTENEGYLNFSLAINKTRPCDIIELTFMIKNTSKKAHMVSIEVNNVIEIKSNRIVDAPYEIVSGVVYLK